MRSTLCQACTLCVSKTDPPLFVPAHTNSLVRRHRASAPWPVRRRSLPTMCARMRKGNRRCFQIRPGSSSAEVERAFREKFSIKSASRLELATKSGTWKVISSNLQSNSPNAYYELFTSTAAHAPSSLPNPSFRVLVQLGVAVGILLSLVGGWRSVSEAPGGWRSAPEGARDATSPAAAMPPPMTSSALVGAAEPRISFFFSPAGRSLLTARAEGLRPTDPSEGYVVMALCVVMATDPSEAAFRRRRRPQVGTPPKRF